MSLPKVNDDDTPAEKETENANAYANGYEDVNIDANANADATRLELIKLSEEGEISQSVKYIKKATNKIILKIHLEYERKQADNARTFLADTLIVKFGELMSGLDIVASDDNFTTELRSDRLLQKNIKSSVRFITPFIPFIGIITGGVILGKHVIKHRNEANEPKDKRKEQQQEPEDEEL